MYLENLPVNYLAVGLAAAAYFVLGAIWYSPAVFGNRWLKHECGQEEMPRTALRYAIEHLDKADRDHYLGLKDA